MFNRPSLRGFSLIEVLVSLVIISIGILGLIAMQGRTIQYTHDSTQRDTAAMLANDLIELMRSNREGALKGHYNKAAGAAFPTNRIAACSGTAGCNAENMAQDHLAMWATQVQNSLPTNAATLQSAYVICVDSTPDTAACDNSGDSIKIQMAWLSRNSENSTEAEANTRRELYQISFQP